MQCEAGEVEGWVVVTIGDGLMDARMDQTAGTVTVSRAVQREFGAAQWKQLEARLRGWRDNVGTLLASVEASTGGGRS